MQPEPLDSGFSATEKVLLYYPTIEIPSPGWIRQGLMYWDKIGSIVPQSYDEHFPPPLRYSDQIQPLYDAKLFRPFNPEDLFNWGWQQNAVDAFQAELLQILDSDEFTKKLHDEFTQKPPEKRKYKAEVYVEKVNESLYQELLQRHLVSPKRDGQFIYFEENTALVYMAVLAKYLADLDHQYTVPSTDLRDYERLNFKAAPEDENKIPAIRVEFRDVLRVPADGVEIERVIEFRLKHADKLLNFRQQVLDKFENEIKKCGERREIKAKTAEFRTQVDRGIRDLDLLMKGAKFQTVTGTMKALFKPQHLTPLATKAMGGAIAAGSGAGAATGSAEIAALAGIIGLAGGAVVELFDFFISRKNAKREKLSASAYSYLYLAEQEFGKLEAKSTEH